MTRLFLILSVCLVLAACGARRPRMVTAAAVSRLLVWDYPPAFFTWGCAPADPVAQGTVTRFEVWADAATTPFDPGVPDVWADAGLVAGPAADTYQYPLPVGLDYRFVRACGQGCAGVAVCGSRVGSIPAVPTNLQIIATPSGGAP